jgi:hypothetical protein
MTVARRYDWPQLFAPIVLPIGVNRRTGFAAIEHLECTKILMGILNAKLHWILRDRKPAFSTPTIVRTTPRRIDRVATEFEIALTKFSEASNEA